MEEDDVDIEGDFDLNSTVLTDGLCGTAADDELPSNSAQLLPEFTQHPWLLEQDWSLDNCSDEKSKAAIERMLREEQYYIDERSHTQFVSDQEYDTRKSPIRKNTRPLSYKKPWSEEEKLLFFKGLEMFGRSWSKIAEFIPSRSRQQVKHFGQQYFKQSCGEVANQTPMTAESMQEMLAHVQTGKPTVRVATSPLGQSSRVQRPPQRHARRTKKAAVLANGPSTIDSSMVKKQGVAQDDPDSNQQTSADDQKWAVSSSLEVIRLQREDEQSTEEDIDIEVDAVDDGYVASSPPSSSSNLSTQPSSQDDPCQVAGISPAPSIKDNPPSSLTDSNSTFITASSIGSDQVSATVSEDNNCATTDVDPDMTKVKDTCDETVCDYNVGNLCKVNSFNSSNGSQVCNESVQDASEPDAIPVKEDCKMNNNTTDTANEFCIVTSTGEEVSLPNPTAEVTILKTSISQQEMRIHSEFFDDRPSLKNPERYLRIRNYIIDTWLKCKPAYLTKTSVRSGLKNCGDVNCIGRIHAFLEQIGAINFGCVQVQYNRSTRPCSSRSTKETPADVKPVVPCRQANARARKRRVRDLSGKWVDEQELEGKTIEHNDDGTEPKRTTTTTVIKTSSRSAYNPFKLVPCQQFTSLHPAPFHLVFETSTLLIMDVHAHLSKTEVIGILGGQYCSEEAELRVMIAEPCKSISTGMQCEMDPVSQTNASERIAEAGQAVVGWYHSHPTFPASPSVRDIETQRKFQEWFAKGGCPFIGVILNPYNRLLAMQQTEITCLIVCDTPTKPTASEPDIGVPMQFNFEVSAEIWNDDCVLHAVRTLIEQYSEQANRINLMDKFNIHSNILCLDKLLTSIEDYIPRDHRPFDRFRNFITEIALQASKPSVKVEETSDLLDAENS